MQKVSLAAANQGGVVTRAQLIAAGLSPAAIRRAQHDGRVHRVHAGVYRVGHAAPDAWATMHAALLAVGHRALLSHGSAAVVWDMADPDRTAPIQVTTDRGFGHQRKGIVAHRPRRFPEWAMRKRHGLRVVSPERAVVELAGTAPTRQVDRVVDRALALELLNHDLLRAEIMRDPHARGAAPLRALLDRPELPEFSRSHAERRLASLINRAELPGPVFNSLVAGEEVDAFWAPQRLVVEFDSWRWHGGRRSFEGDRLKRNKLDAAGYHYQQVTWRELVGSPEAVACRIAQSLALRNPSRLLEEWER